jgi:hypothetical protein
MRGLVASLRLPLLQVVEQHVPLGGACAAAFLGQQQRQIHAGRLTNPWEEVRANPRVCAMAAERSCGSAVAQDASVVLCRCCVSRGATLRNCMILSTH